MAQRSVVSYLLLPRPVNAGILVPVGYIAARLADVSPAVPVGWALVAWLAVDVGLYQARYLLNDLFDVETDRAYPTAEMRGRLAGQPGVRARVLVALPLRVVLSVVAIALLPGRARAIALAAVVGLVVATVVYEAARQQVRRRPLAPGQPVRLSRHEVAVWLATGGGYALRIGFGVALGGGRGDDVAMAAAFGWVLGVLIMIMAGVFEAASLRAYGWTEVLSRKSHIAALTRLFDDDPAALERPLRRGRGARVAAGLLAAASALAVGLGVRLGGSPGAGRLLLMLLVCAVAAPLVMVRGGPVWLGLVPIAMSVPTVAVLAAPGGGDELAFLLLVVTTTVADFRALESIYARVVTRTLQAREKSQQPERASV